MSKRDVTTVSHAALTDHRIVATASEPYPDAAFHLTTPSLPDLIHLSAVPGQGNEPLPPETLLEAYAQVTASDPATYRERYLALLGKLAKSEPENLFVLSALAQRALWEAKPDGQSTATQYLERAVKLGSTYPADYLRLSELLVRANRLPESVEVLNQGLHLAPYNATFYQLLVVRYATMKKFDIAIKTAERGLDLFPEDAALRSLLDQVKSAAPP